MSTWITHWAYIAKPKTFEFQSSRPKKRSKLPTTAQEAWNFAVPDRVKKDFNMHPDAGHVIGEIKQKFERLNPDFFIIKL